MQKYTQVESEGKKRKEKELFKTKQRNVVIQTQKYMHPYKHA